MFKLILEKAEEPEIKLPTSAGSWKKLFIDYAKAFDCVDHNKLWKILKEMGIADHLSCLLRNLYAGQVAWHIWICKPFCPGMRILKQQAAVVHTVTQSKPLTPTWE